MFRWIPAAVICLATLLPHAARAEPQPLRIGLTPVFLDDQVAFLNRWRAYLEKRLGQPVVFVQRASYREITELVRQNAIDVAWVCGLPYVRNASHMRLLAVPVFNGKPLYQSYIIVPASDRTTQSIMDLRGRIFAYSDPDSNSGHLYPQHALTERGQAPATFFSRTFFTWAHRKVIEAVASELAQGGAVDGYVWETLARRHPEITAKTRVVQKSPEFGHTPFVARASLPARDFASVQAVLLGMSDDEQGGALLDYLNLDGFTQGSRGLFDGIARMAKSVANAPTAAVVR
jgi:phosphonate transport system substrate-binding protein